MALAPFIDKAAVAGASLLQGFSLDEFRRRLACGSVGVHFDADSAASAEGRTTLLLVANLLARLYPAISLTSVDDGSAEWQLRQELAEVATGINPDIECHGRRVEHTIVVGSSPLALGGIQPVYVGSDGWRVRASRATPVGSGSTANPFGASIAACIGAAEIFREVFGSWLPRSSAPTQGILETSVLTWRRSSAENPWSTSTLNIGHTYLVGAGAIGNACVWSLRDVPLAGTLEIVDHEAVELSNLQRYVLASMGSVDRPKVHIAREALNAQRDLTVTAAEGRWHEYASQTTKREFENVLVAVDSAAARLQIQATLPKRIVNAWTQPANAGVSRHPHFGIQPCLACLYMPKSKARSEDEIIGDALRVEGRDEIMFLRRLLHSGEAIGSQYVKRLSERFGVEEAILSSFASQSIRQFYVKAACGGILLRGTESGLQAEVPMAFQSAFAGILLAAELVAHAGGWRDREYPTRTEVDVLKGLSVLANQANVPEARSATSRCVCADPAYVRAYERKHGMLRS